MLGLRPSIKRADALERAHFACAIAASLKIGIQQEQRGMPRIVKNAVQTKR
jgi:hypothetical protein